MIVLKRINLKLAMLLLLLAASADAFAATADTPPHEIHWQKDGDDRKMVDIAPSGQAQKIALQLHLTPGAGPARVLTLDAPAIAASSWAIEGSVKYENIPAAGYLEMWSHFPDGSAYFSRTLSPSGPMGILQGNSDWRPFSLPFFSSGGKMPSKLEVNVVLPQGGTVWLASPGVLKQDIKASASKQAGAWWGDRQGGMIGGVMGSLVGVIGGTIGILAARGKNRRLAMSLMITTTFVSAIILAAGIAALLLRQPYAVWYPLVLTGGLGAIIIGALIPVIKRRFAEAELRRMTALDA